MGNREESIVRVSTCWDFVMRDLQKQTGKSGYLYTSAEIQLPGCRSILPRQLITQLTHILTKVERKTPLVPHLGPSTSWKSQLWTIKTAMTMKNSEKLLGRA
jgi:hypothetical protein